MKKTLILASAAFLTLGLVGAASADSFGFSIGYSGGYAGQCGPVYPVYTYPTYVPPPVYTYPVYTVPPVYTYPCPPPPPRVRWDYDCYPRYRHHRPWPRWYPM